MPKTWVLLMVAALTGSASIVSTLAMMAILADLQPAMFILKSALVLAITTVVFILPALICEIKDGD